MDYLEIRELYHHGIKGQRWGIRRFQNEDGSLTAEGMKRYDVAPSGSMSKQGKKLYKKDIKEYKKEVKQDKIANQSTAKRATIGGLKGAGVTILGATALTAAIGGIGFLKMHKQISSADPSFEKAAAIGINTVNKLDLLSKLYSTALGTGIGTGAALAVSKQKQYRKNQEVEHSGIKTNI